MSLADFLVDTRFAAIMWQPSDKIRPSEYPLYWTIREVCEKWFEASCGTENSPAPGVIHCASEEFYRIFLKYSQGPRPSTVEELAEEDSRFRMELIVACRRHFGLLEGWELKSSSSLVEQIHALSDLSDSRDFQNT